ncbi:MAG: amidohydrolase family protein [Bacteroidetes bacterium]|nr:MAG: amidohydrolase family protein [Bacteroidota bacterium]
MKKLLITAAALLGLCSLNAQVDSTERWFTGADIYTATGAVYNNGALGIRNGKIIYVGAKEGAPIQGQTVDVSGKRIYPGLIALNTILGLSEIEAVRATNDFNETGSNNANVRSAIAFNTDSKVIPTVVSNGILTAQVCPRGGIISGQSSVMMLQNRNWEEATYAADNGIHINWPNFNGEEKNDKAAAEQVAKIVGWLQQAKSYSQQKTTEINLKNEALKAALAGTKKVFVHTDNARAMVNAIQTLREFSITPIIVGGAESGQITHILKLNNVAVIISRTHRLPDSYDESYEEPYALPALLWRDSIPFAISDINFWEQRNLPFQAGQAVAFGLPYEEAIKSITLYPAQLLGIEKTTGSLQTGKDATFIVTAGDVLDMRSSKVEQAFLQGRSLDLNDPQRQLYEKYHELILGEKP